MAAKTSPIAQAELADSRTIELPDDFAELWGWFRRLQSTSMGPMGAGCISETEIRSFFMNDRIRPNLWQLEIIRALDNLSRSKEEDDG